jgi:ABC-2 type transport system ATP-binding protein
MLAGGTVTDAVLEVDRIGKRYGAVVAVREFSVTTRAGEVFGIAGPGNAGKSTIVRIACGLVTPDAGLVRWRSAPIDAAARRRIGYLPQGGGLYPDLSALRQLRYRADLHGIRDADHRALYLLDRLGVLTVRELRLAELEPAARQRVAIAATLLPAPELLVLDEPFARLDAAGRDVVAGVLREQASAGVPILLSGNDIAPMETLCHRISIVHDGRSVATGTPEDLQCAGRRVFSVHIDVDPADHNPDWATSIPGCRLVSVDGTRTLLELDAAGDDQALLAAALMVGSVREFTRVRRPLAEPLDTGGWAR